MAQQGVGIGVVLREHGVANAGGDDHPLGIQRVGGRDAFHHAFEQAFAVADRAQPGHEDHELVAAQAGHTVQAPQRPREAACHHHQQAVARAVAQAVVHGLESVQVEVGHAQLGAVLAGQVHAFLQLARQQHAVGQAGEGVKQRQPLQHHLLLALGGHVDGHAQHAGGVALAVKPHDLAQVAHPAGGLAGRVHTPGGVKRGAGVGGVARQLGVDAFDVVGRNGVGPLHRQGRVARGLQAAHGAPAAVARDQAGLQVPVPPPQRRGREGERQQLFALAHLFFLALAVGDVVHREQPAGFAVELGRAHGLQHRAGRAAAHVQRHFVVADLAAGVHLVDEALALFGREDAQLDARAANGLVARDAQHLDPGGVDVHILAVAAPGQAHGVGHEVEDAREALFGLAQALLGAFGLVNVLHHTAHAHHAAVFDHGLAARTHPQQVAVGVLHLHFHAPGRARTQALAELFAQRLAVGGGHMAVDVVAGRGLAGVQAMDVKTHLRPVHQPLAALVLPGAQAGQAAGLLQLVVKRPKFVAGALGFGHVVEYENKAVFAIHKHGACRHQPRDAHAVALRHQRQAVHLAVALEGFDEPLALLLGGPDLQLGRGAPDHLLARAAQHLAKGRVHVHIAAVRDARDARRVGQRLVEGGVLGFGRAQCVLGRAVGGDVHVHADHRRGAALCVAARHGAARHQPAPAAFRVPHAELGLVAFLQPVHGTRQLGGIALGVGRVAPGIPACPQVGRVGIGLGDAVGLIKVAVAAEAALQHIPLPVPATQRVEGQAQLLLALCQRAVGLLQRHHRLRLAHQQLPARAQDEHARAVVPGQLPQPVDGRARQRGTTRGHQAQRDHGGQGDRHARNRQPGVGTGAGVHRAPQRAQGCRPRQRGQARQPDGAFAPDHGQQCQGGRDHRRDGPEIQGHERGGRGVGHHPQLGRVQVQHHQHQGRHHAAGHANQHLGAAGGGQDFGGLQVREHQHHQEQQPASQQCVMGHGGRPAPKRAAFAQDRGVCSAPRAGRTGTPSTRCLATAQPWGKSMNPAQKPCTEFRRVRQCWQGQRAP